MCLSGLEELLLPVRSPAHILISLFFLCRGCHFRKEKKAKKKKEGKIKYVPVFPHSAIANTRAAGFFLGERWIGSHTTVGVSAGTV